MKVRVAVTILGLMLIGCRRSPMEPSTGISGHWTGWQGAYTPLTGVVFATLADSKGVVSGTISWLDGPYDLSGTRADSNTVLTATSTQQPTRTWRFAGFVTNDRLIGIVTSASGSDSTYFVRGDVFPP